MKQERAAIGVIGGSGLYQMEGVTDPTEHRIDTPFGSPSDAIIGGKLDERQVYFLPRHARGHRLLPHELNHRANIYALRSLNVRWIICITAVGSLQEKYAPRDVLRRHKFRYDAVYIRRQSFWLDVRLILLSFWISLRGSWEARGKKF
jgi:5'-methylthioadenosine phosphorylase